MQGKNTKAKVHAPRLMVESYAQNVLVVRGFASKAGAIAISRLVISQTGEGKVACFETKATNVFELW